MTLMRLAHAVLASAFIVIAPACNAGGHVNIYNWTDYIAESTLADFQKATGIQPAYDIFDANEILEAKLLAGRSGYDVVVPSNHFLGRQIQAGIFAPLDRSLLPNYSNLDPAILRHLRRNDPGNTYAVPYLWGTSGIAYNKDMIKKVLGIDTIDSWSALFDPEVIKKLHKCGVAVMDSPDEVYGAAIHYLGGEADKIDQSDYEAATALLKRVRPYITYFHSSKFVSDLANGEICVAMANSGDGLQAISRAKEANNGLRIEYVVPKEGGNLWFDMLAIPADAKNKVEAHAFINFMLDPVNIAKVTEHTGYANPNDASKRFLPASIVNDPIVYPPHKVLRRLYVSSPPPHQIERLVTRGWQSLKTGN
ncbi:polyamine ABC transporter substrate-binding protein [Pseudomonas aeruginosa]|uniref:polyamine ABC transporter substrate-binding protein n=1 Tax=Pseudomonas aeruginosa TaxID=287 RepID=UPI000F6B2FAF|nr:polyamine ABC transporter substrate-binding protein [Pseudomonas aeruginosa]NRR48044.1 polyamine ABC transporter substrate-binding protein [Pseudomonas aeruginosa]RNF58441.1 polyamine ABC transporter substrate-binding protein [Pseudomonas aeruginosa]